MSERLPTRKVQLCSFHFNYLTDDHNTTKTEKLELPPWILFTISSASVKISVEFNHLHFAG